MKTPLRVSCILLLVFPILDAQTTNPVNRAIEQGRTSPEDEGRLRARQQLDDRNTTTVTGMLIDAACPDRSAENLARTPQAPALAPAQARNVAGSNGSAKGIVVSPKTLTNERADVMEHQVPDLRARTSDLTCAVTGNTKGFSILLDNGHLLNLDEAGNTLALETVQSSAAGRAMLNGTGPALKPKVTLRGIVHSDELLVKRIVSVSD